MTEQGTSGEIDLSGDGGVTKKMIQEGEGVERPHDGIFFENKSEM